MLESTYVSTIGTCVKLVCVVEVSSQGTVDIGDLSKGPIATVGNWTQPLILGMWNDIICNTTQTYVRMYVVLQGLIERTCVHIYPNKVLWSRYQEEILLGMYHDRIPYTSVLQDLTLQMYANLCM